MSGVEAVRVMAVVEDMIGGIRIMSHLTADVRQAGDTIEDILGQRISIKLIERCEREPPTNRRVHAQEIWESVDRHNQALAAAKSSVASDDLMRSVLDIWRKIKKTPGAEAKLASLATERTDSMLQVMELLSQLQGFVKKRMTTTVEEDNSQREHFEEVKIREEKAMSEKQQLQQKLKLERIERQKQINLITEEEERANSQLNVMKANHAMNMQGMQQSASQERGQENNTFQERDEVLNAEVLAAEKRLDALRAENSERMLNMRKAKKKCELDAEAAITEYDKELTERDEEYQKELAMFTQLTQQLEERQESINSMQANRSQHEDHLRRAALAVRKQALENLVMRRAVRVIKEHWYAYQAAKKKAKKAAGKAKPKKK